MGLSVSIGVRALVEDDAAWRVALSSLVASGCTTLVRDVVIEADGARGIEARRADDGSVAVRSLDGDELEALVAGLGSVEEMFGTSTASFSWKQLEEIGAGDVQDLALTFDTEDAGTAMVSIDMAGATRRAISLSRSLRNWHDDRLQGAHVAFGLHGVAAEHRLIVCSL